MVTMKAVTSLVVYYYFLQSSIGLFGAAASPYAPSVATCPSQPLLRIADSISPVEANYVRDRSVKASTSLNQWLQSLNAGFPNVSQASAPVVAASWSGGGYRALLMGAGMRQSFDVRDSSSPVSGVYQSLTYESGLSGGGWFLAGIVSDNYPTISYLTDKFYPPNIQAGSLSPGGPPGVIPNDLNILLNQVASKQAAGYEVNMVDFYGRLLGYSLLEGAERGVAKHFSDAAESANFSAHNVPLPIVTFIAINSTGDRCNDLMDPSQAQMEATPSEFGSWDKSINTFVPTTYIGTRLSNGQPITETCTTGYDNTGFLRGTSINIYPWLSVLSALLIRPSRMTSSPSYAPWSSSSSSFVGRQTQLTLPAPVIRTLSISILALLRLILRAPRSTFKMEPTRARMIPSGLTCTATSPLSA